MLRRTSGTAPSISLLLLPRSGVPPKLLLLPPPEVLRLLLLLWLTVSLAAAESLARRPVRMPAWQNCLQRGDTGSLNYQPHASAATTCWSMVRGTCVLAKCSNTCPFPPTCRRSPQLFCQSNPVVPQRALAVQGATQLHIKQDSTAQRHTHSTGKQMLDRGCNRCKQRWVFGSLLLLLLQWMTCCRQTLASPAAPFVWLPAVPAPGRPAGFGPAAS